MWVRTQLKPELPGLPFHTAKVAFNLCQQTRSIGKISIYKHCFCYSTANEALVGTLMTIADVSDIFHINEQECFRVLNHEARPNSFGPDKTRPASLLNGFKNIPKKRVSWNPNKSSNCEKRTLPYKKNKLCLISMLYIKNSSAECFISF